MCRRFDTIPACDRRTEGQTNRQTDGIAVASTALVTPALRRAVKTRCLEETVQSRVSPEAGRECMVGKTV